MILKKYRKGSQSRKITPLWTEALGTPIPQRKECLLREGLISNAEKGRSLLSLEGRRVDATFGDVNHRESRILMGEECGMGRKRPPVGKDGDFLAGEDAWITGGRNLPLYSLGEITRRGELRWRKDGREANLHRSHHKRGGGNYRVARRSGLHSCAGEEKRLARETA